MDGIKINGVTLFVGKLPRRKQACFYFTDGTTLFPVAYIRPEYESMVNHNWQKMLDGIQVVKEQSGLPQGS